MVSGPKRKPGDIDVSQEKKAALIWEELQNLKPKLKEAEKAAAKARWRVRRRQGAAGRGVGGAGRCCWWPWR